MTSALAFPEKRRELLYALLRAGFQARMHSYEYFIIKGGKFVSIIVLSPTWNMAKIERIGWNHRDSTESAEDIVIILREIDPGIEIEIN